MSNAAFVLTWTGFTALKENTGTNLISAAKILNILRVELKMIIIVAPGYRT